MSCSFRSTKTSYPMSARGPMASGPAALYSSRPTLAVPNHGWSCLAMRSATTRSSTSSTNANRDRAAASGWWSSDFWTMGPSDELVDRADAMASAPVFQAGQHLGGCPRVGEGRRPDLHRLGTGQKQLDGAGRVGDAAHPDDGQFGQRGPDVVDRADRHRVDGRAGQPSPAVAQAVAAGL